MKFLRTEVYILPRNIQNKKITMYFLGETVQTKINLLRLMSFGFFNSS